MPINILKKAPATGRKSSRVQSSLYFHTFFCYKLISILFYHLCFGSTLNASREVGTLLAWESCAWSADVYCPRLI